jgi:hypothetical protein
VTGAGRHTASPPGRVPRTLPEWAALASITAALVAAGVAAGAVGIFLSADPGGWLP